MPVELSITMDEDLYERLQKELPLRQLSSFVNEAVRARLQPDHRALDAAYKAASKEPWRREVTDDWQVTETEDWPA
jgi:Arc/MetJ family transcription regulator